MWRVLLQVSEYEEQLFVLITSQSVFKFSADDWYKCKLRCVLEMVICCVLLRTKTAYVKKKYWSSLLFLEMSLF